jgi:DNA-binding GntR family transcriptional regulator
MLPIDKPVELSELAYERIKRAIMDMSFQPGEMIYEPRLARVFEISRTPVREALIRLEQEDWIASTDGQGYVVKHLTSEDIGNIYEMRMLLEPHATRLFVEQASDPEISIVSAPLEEIRSQLESQRYDLYFEFHRRLHQVIIDKCPNELLQRALINLKERMVRIRNFTGYRPDRHAPASLEEQRQFQEALHDRNGAKAAQAMALHILTARDRVLAQLAETMAAREQNASTQSK